MVPRAETWNFTGKQIALYISFLLKYTTRMWQKRRASTGNWEVAVDIEGCLGGDRGLQKARAGSGSAWCTGKVFRLPSRSRLRLSGNTLLVRGHGQIHSVPGILSLQFLYLLHRDV